VNPPFSGACTILMAEKRTLKSSPWAARLRPAVWFIGELAQDAKDFDDWDSAVKWVEEVRVELKADGWQNSN